MFSILKGPKDAVLSGLGRLLINKWGIAKYGAMTSLALDSKRKTISFSLTLKGEKEPIDVEVRVRVEKQSGTSVLLIASRSRWQTRCALPGGGESHHRVNLPDGKRRHVISAIRLGSVTQ